MNLFDHILILLTNHVFSDDQCDNSTEFITTKTSSEEVSNNQTETGRVIANFSIQRFVKTLPPADCHREGKVLFEDGGCYNLLERGPCFEQVGCDWSLVHITDL